MCVSTCSKMSSRAECLTGGGNCDKILISRAGFRHVLPAVQIKCMGGTCFALAVARYLQVLQVNKAHACQTRSICATAAEAAARGACGSSSTSSLRGSHAFGI